MGRAMTAYPPCACGSPPEVSVRTDGTLWLWHSCRRRGVVGIRAETEAEARARWAVQLRDAA